MNNLHQCDDCDGCKTGVNVISPEMRKGRVPYMKRAVSAAAALIIIMTSFGAAEGEKITDNPPSQDWESRQISSKDEAVSLDKDYGSPELVAENDRFLLYIEYEKYNMAIADKESGIVWYTSPPAAQKMEKELSGIARQMISSQLHVSYVNTENRATGSVNSHLGCVRQKTVSASNIQNGIRIIYDFSRPEECFRIPVEYLLTDYGLNAKIDFSNIEEYGETIISEVTLLPHFGSVGRGNTGYLFIPDGSGSIIEFDSMRSSWAPYSQPVYGRDSAYSLIQSNAPAEDIYLPVFGQCATPTGFAAIIDEGASLASVNALPSGADNEFNYVNASFLYRGVDNAVLADASWISKNIVLYSKNTSTAKKVGVRYCLLPNADLTDMALEYRNYIVEKHDIASLKDSYSTLYLEFYGGIKRKKSYFGIILDSIVPMTTFKQAGKIINDLESFGAESMTVKYNGVLKGGMDNSVVLDTNLEGALGGKQEFNELSDVASGHKTKIYADFEFSKFYESRLFWWPFNCASKMLSQSPITVFPYRKSTFFRDLTGRPAYLLAPGKIDKEISKFLKKEKLPENVGIGSGSLGSFLYSDFNTKNFYDRQRTQDVIVKNLQALSDSGHSLLINGGYDYAAVQGDDLFGIPMSDSLFDVSLTYVPFYSMVFHGYRNMCSRSINMSEDPKTIFLQCMEQGINPAFTFTYLDGSKAENTPYDFLICTQYGLWTNTAISYYKEFSEQLSGTFDQTITDYKIINKRFRKTTYSDGTVVYVNFGKEVCTDGSIIVDAMSYKVLRVPNGGEVE